MNAVLLEGEVAATALDKVLGGVSSMMKLSGDMLTYMVDNPIYLALLATGFIFIGCRIFRVVKRSAQA